MGIMQCEIHGWSGITSLTKAAADIYDKKIKSSTIDKIKNIILVELHLDEISFLFLVLKDEIPIAGAINIDCHVVDKEIFNIRAETEEAFDSIVGELLPRCGNCLRENIDY